MLYYSGMKNPVGRPTKYNEMYCDLLEQILSNGGFNVTFCKAVGIHEDTFYEWVKKHPRFSESLKKGNASAKSDFLEKVYNGAFDPKNNPANNGLVYLLAVNCYGMSSTNDKKQDDNSAVVEALSDLSNTLPD